MDVRGPVVVVGLLTQWIVSSNYSNQRLHENVLCENMRTNEEKMKIKTKQITIIIIINSVLFCFLNQYADRK